MENAADTSARRRATDSPDGRREGDGARGSVALDVRAGIDDEAKEEGDEDGTETEADFFEGSVAPSVSASVRSAPGSVDEEAHVDDDDDDDDDDVTEADVGFYQDSIVPSTVVSMRNVPVSVQAPPFAAVHRSWGDFDTQLKTYAQSTYQLYVVRTTTSVQRRNLRIAELTATATAGSSNVDTDDAVEDGDEGEAVLPPLNERSERLMIPAHLKWYSKTMMCTHGWKDRHRGTGKRSMAMVRSTGCPVKMCITVQHMNDTAEDDDEDDGWRVVVTKHVRTHNHPLSKELYLFYTENRRIYDPELLALVGGTSPNGTALAAEFYGAFGDDDGETTHAIPAGQGPDNMLPGSIPLLTPKAFNSWENFHEVLNDYSLVTQQHFRIRSTISTQSKNSKTLEQAAKTGKAADDVSVLLVPEELKWSSKLLICNHGWKRKSRSKMVRFQPQELVEEWNELNPNACPAMIMARLQRDIHDKWRIVINRQVVSHNHALYALDTSVGEAVQLPGGTASDLEESSTAVALLNPALTARGTISTTDDERNEEFVNAAVRHLGELQPPSASNTSEEQDHTMRASVQSIPAPTFEALLQATPELQPVSRPMSIVTEVVVRVAKLQAIHASWEAFHACLQQYSESTYQSYRTRTTSSVAGRNQKILEMRANNATSISAFCGMGEDGSVNGNDDASESTRLIPEPFKWYSKTLTCTHGWKQRRRGSGKRTIHIVRSTLCPVKICATLQYLEPNSSNTGEVGWRVVVTKHIVDHNHNLSKELYQHYRDNRRIYDPALLAIDQSTPTSGLGGSTNSQVSTSAVTTTSTTVASGNDASASANGEHHALFAGNNPVGFDQTEGFNAQHELPESAYIVPNPGNPNQPMLLMVSGMSLSAFSTIPAQTSTAFHSSVPSTLHASTSIAMHQMYGQGSVFPSASFSASQVSSTFGSDVQASAESNRICQLHGSISPSQAPNVAGAECTCLRVPLMHHLAGEMPTSSESIASGGKRRARISEANQGSSVQSSKRPRTGRDSSDPQFQDRPLDHSLGLGGSNAAVSGTDNSGANSTEPQAPVWSRENLAQVLMVTEPDGTVVWRAPRLKRRHETWDEFADQLSAYSISTFQLYRVRTTSSIAARNTRIFQQLQQMQDEGAGRTESQDQEEPVPQLVPTSYEWYSKTYVCTHGWKERRRGKGQRVSHNLRSTACPVKICVTLQRDPHDAENWNVVVTKHVLDHNHEISLSVFQGYSENRRIKDPQLLAQAEQMWREGQPRRKVFDFLKGATKSNIVMKDVHNLVQRWQQQQQPEASTITASVLGHRDQPSHAQESGSRPEPEPDLDLVL